REIAGHLHDRRRRSDLAVDDGRHTRKVHFERRGEGGIGTQQTVDRLEEEDVRACQEVNAVDGASEHTPQEGMTPLTVAELRVEIAGMHDAEDTVAARVHRTLEVSG